MDYQEAGPSRIGGRVRRNSRKWTCQKCGKQCFDAGTYALHEKYHLNEKATGPARNTNDEPGVVRVPVFLKALEPAGPYVTITIPDSPSPSRSPSPNGASAARENSSPITISSSNCSPVPVWSPELPVEDDHVDPEGYGLRYEIGIGDGIWNEIDDVNQDFPPQTQNEFQTFYVPESIVTSTALPIPSQRLLSMESFAGPSHLPSTSRTRMSPPSTPGINPDFMFPPKGNLTVGESNYWTPPLSDLSPHARRPSPKGLPSFAIPIYKHLLDPSSPTSSCIPKGLSCFNGSIYLPSTSPPPLTPPPATPPQASPLDLSSSAKNLRCPHCPRRYRDPATYQRHVALHFPWRF